MQENDFEKRVEDKLAGLKLPPSDAVWAAVEAELHKKKRRRVIFFIFLLAGLALAGYTGYTLLDTSSKTSLAHEQNLPVNNGTNDQPAKDEKTVQSPEGTLKNNDKTAIGVKEDDEINEEATSVITEKEEKEQPVPGGEKLSADTKVKLIKAKEQSVVNSKEKTTVRKPLEKNKTVKEKKESNTKRIEEIIFADRTATYREKETVRQNDPTGSGDNKANEIPGATDKVVTDEVKKEDSVVVTDTLKAHAVADSTAADLAKEELVQVKKIAPKKIKWGIDLSAGATFSRNEVFSVANSGRVYADRSYFNNSPISSGVPPNPGGVEPPSSVSAGPAFKAGVFAEKNLSKRSSVTAGLRYAYLSERMKVGAYKDSFIVSNSYFSNATNNGFYSPARQKTHVNSYHFIELPLSYQLLLNKSGKVQVRWNTGVMATYLVNTNALVYDTTAGGIYYKQPDVINRFHINMQTGLALRFVTKKNFAWSVGPELSLDMTRLMKKDIFTRERYLFYGGLSAKVFLPSLKK